MQTQLPCRARIAAASGLFDEIEPEPARAFARAGSLAAREPQERRSIRPPRVLELANNPNAPPRHLLLEQGEIRVLGLENASKRFGKAGLAALVDQGGCAAQADVRLAGVDALRLERDPIVGHQGCEAEARVAGRLLRWRRDGIGPGRAVALGSVERTAGDARRKPLHRPDEVRELVADEQDLLDRLAVQARRENRRQEERVLAHRGRDRGCSAEREQPPLRLRSPRLGVVRDERPFAEGVRDDERLWPEDTARYRVDGDREPVAAV